MIDITTAFAIAIATILFGASASTLVNAIIGSATINRRFSIILVGFVVGIAALAVQLMFVIA